MSKTKSKTVNVLKQFSKDLESGDLSKYRITKLVKCPLCKLRAKSTGCAQCGGRGIIQLVVQEGSI